MNVHISISSWRLCALLTVTLLMSLLPAATATAAHVTADFSGRVGAIVDGDTTSERADARVLRHVGDPAPEGYAHTYQWGAPYLEVDPEDEAVVLSGTIDVSRRVPGSVAMIGLSDKSALRAGDDYQKGAYIYVFAKSANVVTIGVSDGNAGGGEIVQAFQDITLGEGIGSLGVTFTVDGTVSNFTECDKPAGSSSAADGCMTLDIANGASVTTIRDSYGTITGNATGTEFAEGAIPGWESWPNDDTGIEFALNIATAARGRSLSGTVGAVSDSATTPGQEPASEMMLRYVDDPAADGYAHTYQWGRPYVEVHPEEAPVVFEGAIDLSHRVPNSVAMIGLSDKSALLAGTNDYQKGAYIYVFAKGSDVVRIGVSDGNAGGGEIVQIFRDITIGEGTQSLGVTFTVDGTVSNFTECDKPAGSSSAADGCMTLQLAGYPAISDSYGTITDNAAGTEFADGAIPGWEAFPADDTGISYDTGIAYDLVVSDEAAADRDGDSAPDSTDAFPNDPTETIDSDNDGVGNNADDFPSDPDETTDSDADGVGDNGDNCVTTSNASQADNDGDGTGNECDTTPNGSGGGSSGGTTGGGGSTPPSQSPSPTPATSASPTPTPSASATPAPTPTEDPDDDEVLGDKTVRSHVSIRYGATFRGRVRSVDDSCVADRIVVLRRKRADGSVVRKGRDVTGAHGRWAIDRSARRGSWFIVVRDIEIANSTGGTTTCLRDKSKVLRIPAL